MRISASVEQTRFDQLALGRLARDDRPGLHGLVAEVQSELGLAGLLVGPVAGVALASEDRPHVAVEVHRRHGVQGSGDEQGHGNREADPHASVLA